MRARAFLGLSLVFRLSCALFSPQYNCGLVGRRPDKPGILGYTTSAKYFHLNGAARMRLQGAGYTG